VLACKNGDGPDCLTASQIDVARKIYGGTTNPRTGDSLFPGRPPGSELGWAWPAERTEPARIADSHFKHVVFEDPNWDFRTFDFDRDYARAQAVDSGRLTAVNPDLNAFISRGGKLLMFHGWNDMDITAYNSINYFESVRSAIGASRIENSVRLFMAPGMGHCNGALGPRQTEWLTALEAWVERGVAPNQIIPRPTNNVVDRTRPLCPYPQVARYSGQGNTDDPANFSCIAPDARR
jgi:feruloyl esterase